MIEETAKHNQWVSDKVRFEEKLKEVYDSMCRVRLWEM